jgi:hypothetical protein
MTKSGDEDENSMNALQVFEPDAPTVYTIEMVSQFAGCRQSAWGKVLGEDRHPRRLESEVLGKVDRKALGPHDEDLQQEGKPGSAKKCGNDSKAMRCQPPDGSAKSSCSQ